MTYFADRVPEARMPPMVSSRDQPPVALRRLIFDAWSGLWRPREQVLRERYVDYARSAGVDLTAAASLEEVRQQFFTRMPGTSLPSDYERDEFERRMLRGSRLVAAWMFWWTACVPLACVVWVFHRRIVQLPGPDWIAAGVTVIGSFCAFWLFCILGLLVQALFMRPFVAFVNWSTSR